jgi:hypothetical protein
VRAAQSARTNDATALDLVLTGYQPKQIRSSMGATKEN